MENQKILDEKELKEMFVKYKDPLYGFIYTKMQNHHDSEDIFSKTFIKFINYAQRNPIRLDTAKSFLYKIASNNITDFFRHKKIINFVSFDKKINDDNDTFIDLFEDTKSRTVFDDIDNKHLVQTINSSISTLPDKQKEAFYLRFIEGFSFSEIAKIQSATISTVLSRVRYSVDKIRVILKEKMEL